VDEPIGVERSGQGHPDEEPDEKSRIEALRAGSEEAFDWLIGQYAAPVFRLAYRMLDDHADASDAVQEVFLKVFRNIGEFQGDSSLKTWIYRIAVNTAANQKRWWRRHKGQELSIDNTADGESESCFAPVDHAQNPFEALLSREAQEMVRTAMASLPECFRTVLVLREMESLSYDEIAEILHISLGTVKSRLARARHALKSELEVVMESGPAALPAWNPAAE
jgi:RNA polymerase sigma-70 factor, ECF subfamily